MSVVDNSLYKEDIQYIANYPLPWSKMMNKAILISGASGLVGSCLVDAIMWRNMNSNLNCNILALGRNTEKAKKRFSYCWSRQDFKFISHDISVPFNENHFGKVDYIIHLASNTHPVAYSTDPIGTITTNIFGTYNLLEYASEYKTERFVFASSNEIYGENRGDVELFDEDYCGYINSNTMRAGYSESKRCSEALCQAYIQQKKIDITIARLTRSYGPTMLMSDTKAISQFIRKAVNEENIVLKSAGNQHYSYTYVADAVTGLLTVLLEGKNGEAYNIADSRSDVMLKDLADNIANVAGTKVIFELPDELESAGYSMATKARLSSEKIKKLGWSAAYDIRGGIERTIGILKEVGSSV